MERKFSVCNFSVDFMREILCVNFMRTLTKTFSVDFMRENFSVDFMRYAR